MINFPDATYIHRRMPKEAFYKRLSLTTALKDKFISDVDRIYIENSLTKDNLNLTADSEVKEILLLSRISGSWRFIMASYTRLSGCRTKN